MASTEPMNKPKNWFALGEGPFERTLGQQLEGLGPLFADVRAQRVAGNPATALDVACAEGLIAIELCNAGAHLVHGVELVPERVADARRLSAGLACSFEVGDATRYRPRHAYAVVLFLAILHKLPNPSATLRSIVSDADPKLVVVRSPPADARLPGFVVVDRRSGLEPHDLNAVLCDLGFSLTEEAVGPLGEWVGYWRRAS